jgi:hypothetical protein
MPIRADIPVYLLRSTRDEASLALGLAQALHAVSFAFAQYTSAAENRDRANSPLWWSIGPLILFLGPIWGAYCLIGDASLSAWQLAGWSFVLAAALPSIVYVMSFTMLAVSVGFFPIRAWRDWMPEVDYMPPEKSCSVKSHFRLSPEVEGLRHGIYRDKEVLADIAHLLEGFAKGIVPQFMASPRVEEEDGRSPGPPDDCANEAIPLVAGHDLL